MKLTLSDGTYTAAREVSPGFCGATVSGLLLDDIKRLWAADAEIQRVDLLARSLSSEYYGSRGLRPDEFGTLPAATREFWRNLARKLPS